MRKMENRVYKYIELCKFHIARLNNEALSLYIILLLNTKEFLHTERYDLLSFVRSIYELFVNLINFCLVVKVSSFEAFI